MRYIFAVFFILMADQALAASERFMCETVGSQNSKTIAYVDNRVLVLSPPDDSRKFIYVAADQARYEEEDNPIKTYITWNNHTFIDSHASIVYWLPHKKLITAYYFNVQFDKRAEPEARLNWEKKCKPY